MRRTVKVVQTTGPLCIAVLLQAPGLTPSVGHRQPQRRVGEVSGSAVEADRARRRTTEPGRKAEVVRAADDDTEASSIVLHREVC